MLYKTGQDIRKKEARQDKKRRGSARQGAVRAHDFSDTPWGFRARNLVRGSKGLSLESWELIMDAASEYLKFKDDAKGNQSDQGEEELIDNMHAYIDLDW